MTHGHCAQHPKVKLQCPACLRGAPKATPAQRRASRENGKLGGRPKPKWRAA